MDVKPGYKQTETGVIPEDWKVDVLHSCVRSDAPICYGILMPGQFHAGGVPVIKVKDIVGGRIDETELLLTHPSIDVAYKRSRLQPGDILVTIRGSTGRVAVVQIALRNANITQDTARARIKGDLSSRYVFVALQSQSVQNQIALRTIGQAVKGINIRDVKTLAIPFPPTKVEQEAIAGALGDADALIEALEQLIAKKRQIKHGTMQQLLTGQKRLPGFSGEWEVRTLGSIGTTYSGLTGKTKADFGEGRASYITFMNVMSNVVIDCSTFERVNVLPTEQQNRVLKGDLLFNGSSETPEEVAMCAILTADVENLFLNSFCFGFRFHESIQVVGLFLSYYLRSNIGRELMKSLAQGSTRYNLSKVALLKSQLRMPTLSEQKSIAAVLSDLDAEVKTLETKLAKARLIKQGMMQELLTGRIRLVESSTVPLIDAVPKESLTRKTRQGHTWEFNESVVIAALVDQFGSLEFPLGRKRCTKLTYLLHRKAEQQATGYLKKAAGPYNPKTRYAGPEKIALEKRYIREHVNGKFNGWVADENFPKAKAYFLKWYGTDLVNWLEQFRKRKNDDLECLATVDMAMQDLLSQGKPITVESVRDLIASEPEWLPKLERPVFSDAGIKSAIASCRELFPE